MDDAVVVTPAHGGEHLRGVPGHLLLGAPHASPVERGLPKRDRSDWLKVCSKDSV